MVRLSVLAAVLAVAAPALAQTAAQTPTPATTPATPQTGARIVAKAIDPYAPTDPVELEAWLRARGETYHRAPDAQQDPTELAQTASLNAEIAARNDRAEAQDKADLAAHEAATAKYEAAVSAAASAAATAQANYEADLRAAQAAQAQYERDQADWRRRVAACQAGDRRACDPAG